MKDVEEAVMALANYGAMRDAGIDQAFATLFAHNMKQFEHLPSQVQNQIKDQFLSMAHELSQLEGVVRKSSEQRVEELAMWLKQINLLLAMTKTLGAG